MSHHQKTLTKKAPISSDGGYVTLIVTGKGDQWALPGGGKTSFSWEAKKIANECEAWLRRGMK